MLNVAGGAKMTIQSSKKVSFSASVLRTIYAVNNPILLTVDAGLTVSDLGSRRE